ncbi:MAG TPA: EAL domain-containing protein [Beijerinckiaceae bacterium]|jgi:diguanylate cyclase (GGDEF)-like protein
MASGVVFSRRSHGVLLSRLVWPTTILFALTLCVVFAMILWTSDSANQVAAQRQRFQLQAAVEQKLEDLRDRLTQLAASPALFEVIRTGSSNTILWRFGKAAEYFEFDGAFLITPEGKVLSGMADRTGADQAAFDRLRPLWGSTIATVAAELAAADTAITGEDDRAAPRAMTRLMSEGSQVYAAIALPIAKMPALEAEAGPVRLIAVALKRYSPTDLQKIAALHAIEDFEIVEQAPAGARAALALTNAAGDVSAYAVWRPERPGDLMRERLVPLTLFGSCLALALFGVVVIYIRWIAKDLAQSQETTQNLLGHDPLSGLANRMLFGERLDQELNRLGRTGGSGLAVMFLDLDRFKDVNDTYGHQVGDELIKLVAKRLGALLRGGDTLARFGGDEFAIIQTDLRGAANAETLAKRILDALTAPFEIGDTPVTVGVSIGISLAPDNGTDRETLMRLADTALYQAKSEGRNRHSFFERKMDETIRMRKVVEDDLRLAITGNELALHYQPVYSADGQNIVGLEALVRWPHPEQGLISPARFIALAEERGLVIPLGEWVLRQACRDGKRWPGLRIAVNVSPIQFRHRDFVMSVMRALRETGFEASRLELELTEGVVVEDADAAEAAMMELRAMGVHLALDDFGTGYSSLIYLRRFAFDKIKIDRSFLESMEATGESAILVHSIVHLGRALGLTVTAEGVETKEQHRFLQALGCHQLQGFLFSKPVPAHEIDRMLGYAPGGAEAQVSAA